MTIIAPDPADVQAAIQTIVDAINGNLDHDNLRAIAGILPQQLLGLDKPVSALPTQPAPFDGQLCLFQTAAMETAGIPPWLLRYRAKNGDGSVNAAAKKWEVLQGQPLVAENALSFATSTTIHQYTKDVNVTVPAGGEYLIEVGCDVWSAGAACFLEVADLVNAETAPASGADAETANLVPGGNTTRMPATRRRHSPRTLAAGDVVNAAFASGTTGVAATVDHRWLRVTPVRLG